VYVDNDPVVLAHARALLTSGPEGRTDYIDADLRDPARILEQAAKTLDFDRPVALCLVAILHFVADEEAYPLVRGLLDALPVGSRLVLSHLTEDLNPENIRAVQRTYTERGFTFVLRSRAEVERFFTENSLEIADPGVVPAHRWRPDHAAPVPERPEESYLAGLDAIERVRYHDINDVTDADINVYAGMAAKG
jgi:O-methyltransferase involved in polyketide biosynthesis